MQRSFRTKLLSLVATTGVAFVIVIVSGIFVSNRVEQQLTTIRDLYVPRVDLEPRLQASVERMAKGFQDAVAAREPDALAQTSAYKVDFLAQLDSARDAISPADAAALRSAMESYFDTAQLVSKKLMSAETGEGVVDAVSQMQAKYKTLLELVPKATRFEREELNQAFTRVAQQTATGAEVRLVVSVICLLLVLGLTLWLSRGVVRAVQALADGFGRFSTGNFEQAIWVDSKDELAEVATRANQMALNLKHSAGERDRLDWLKAGQVGLLQQVQGELEPAQVADRLVSFLCRYLDAPVGALYYLESGALQLLGRHTAGAAGRFALGEGPVGQAALQTDLRVVNDPPGDYLKVHSGLGEGAPKSIAFLPLLLAGKTTAVIELALFRKWPERATELLLLVRETAAIALEMATTRAETTRLLVETQNQAQRLASQEEELRSTNELLRSQQEELRQTNEELTQQAEELEVQRQTLQERNSDLVKTRQTLEEKNAELVTVSGYKSQFLTNMSHELRTPLNSMLLLSNLLAENDGKNLTEKQVEFCKTIYMAGKDLLALINQVLDLAKVESGKQQVRLENVFLSKLADRARRVFEPQAKDRKLDFTVEIDPGLPASLTTDNQRIEQILTNLLGNAMKFTERGNVRLRMHRPELGTRFRRADLQVASTLAFSVRDSGPGIAPEHRDRVFAPFEQGESTAARRYGGTGLGLSIARELAALLGGEIQLNSELGKGSTFICYLPDSGPKPQPGEVSLPLVPASPPRATQQLAAPVDDRAGLQSGEPFLLVVEDDRAFLSALAEVMRNQGIKWVLATDGTTGIKLAQELKPTGVILDVTLPDIDGFTVMQKLRENKSTAEIPVHFVSAVDAAERGMALGAVGYLTKPAAHRDLLRVVQSLNPAAATVLKVLVVEPAEGESLVNLLNREGLQVQQVTRATDALELLTREKFGCMVLDLSLPDMDGLTLLQRVQDTCGKDMPSVLIYTGRALSKEETKRLEAYADAIVLKEGPSAERLLNEIRLFVRRLRQGNVRRASAGRVHPSEVRLSGKKILVVDDDMRTVYALSATLRAKGAEVLVADTGKVALDMLAQNPAVEAVLMDIMMPEMDGYEAIRRIRQLPRFQKLPIIALTAKAMKGDEERCLEAGATDYLPKPIDAERLLLLLSQRLPRG